MIKHDPFDIRGQVREQELREQMLSALRMERAEDVKKLMSEPWGRRLMWNLLADARTYHRTFNPDSLLMAYAEGRRSFGLDLLAYIQMTAPERYVEMLTEASKKEITEPKQ